MSSMPLKLSNGKRVGEIIEDRAIIPVSSRNYLGIAKGFSLDGEVLHSIVCAGCDWIDFTHVKTKKVFRISVEAFQENARPYNFGFGEKLAAPDSLYQVIALTPQGLSNLYA